MKALEAKTNGKIADSTKEVKLYVEEAMNKLLQAINKKNTEQSSPNTPKGPITPRGSAGNKNLASAQEQLRERLNAEVSRYEQKQKDKPTASSRSNSPRTIGADDPFMPPSPRFVSSIPPTSPSIHPQPLSNPPSPQRHSPNLLQRIRLTFQGASIANPATTRTLSPSKQQHSDHPQSQSVAKPNNPAPSDHQAPIRPIQSSQEPQAQQPIESDTTVTNLAHKDNQTHQQIAGNENFQRHVPTSTLQRQPAICWCV